MTRHGAPDLIHAVLRVGLGVVLVYAAVPKLLAPAQFADVVANYRLLPSVLVSWVAITLPWLELLTGLCLILGVFVTAAALLSVAMFATFTVALASVQVRGLDISCGCFSVAATTGGGGHSLWQTPALAIVSGLVLWRTKSSPWPSVVGARTMTTTTRRRAIIAAAAVLGCLLAVGVVMTVVRTDEDPAVAHTRGELVLMARRDVASSGALDRVRKAVAPDTVSVVTPMTQDDVLKLLEEGKRPDVIDVALDQVPWLVEHGYIQPLDPGRLRNWANVPSDLRAFPGAAVDGVPYAAPREAEENGVLFRTDAISVTPRSYRSLFSKAVRNRSVMADDVTLAIRMGVATLRAAESADPDARGLRRIRALLETDEPHFLAYYRDDAELAELIRAGMVDIAVGDRATAERLQAEGLPVSFVIPREGPLVRGRGLAIASSAEELDTAYAAIDSYLGAIAAASTPPDGRLPVTPADAWGAWKETWREVLLPPGSG